MSAKVQKQKCFGRSILDDDFDFFVINEL